MSEFGCKQACCQDLFIEKRRLSRYTFQAVQVSSTDPTCPRATKDPKIEPPESSCARDYAGAVLDC